MNHLPPAPAFALLGPTDSLTVELSGAAATVEPTYAVLIENSHAVGETTGATPVTIVAAPNSGLLPVQHVSVFNGDTAEVTVTVKKDVSGTGYTLAKITLAAGDLLWLDGSGVQTVNTAGNEPTADSFAYGDAVDLGFGDSTDAIFRWSTGDASDHSLVVGLGDTSQMLHITDKAAIATDFAITSPTHPTLYVHSNTTPITDYLLIGGHDGTVATIDVVGGTTLYVKAAGNEIADFVQTASAVNGLKFLSNSTGAAPVIGSNGNGAEADIGLNLVDSNGNELLEFVAVASATNGLKVTNATTGNPVRIGANGTGATANRGIRIDDSNGNELAVLVSTASAVNEVTITNQAAGSDPSISATGGDTDINLGLAAKGAGFVAASSPVQVRSSTAVTATTGGGTTGLIPAGAALVVVTSDDADKQISLPAATVGDRIRILVGATGCELISAVATHKVNDVTVGATNEAALTAENLYDCQYVATDTWVVIGYTKLGAVQAALVPDAL
jgi:hypothetical protein